jgi:hypothetical protein
VLLSLSSSSGQIAVSKDAAGNNVCGSGIAQRPHRGASPRSKRENPQAYWIRGLGRVKEVLDIRTPLFRRHDVKVVGGWFLLSRSLGEEYVSRSRSRAGVDSKREKRSGVCACLECGNGRRKYGVVGEEDGSQLFRRCGRWTDLGQRVRRGLILTFFFFGWRGCGWWKGGQRHFRNEARNVGRRAAEGGAVVASNRQGVEITQY